MKTTSQLILTLLTPIFGLTTAAVAQDRPRDRAPEVEFEIEADGDPEVEARLQALIEDFIVDQAPDRPRDRDQRRNRNQAAESETAPAPWRIGIGCEPVNPILRAHLPIPEDAGVIVDQVLKKSPAAKAGVRENDIIIIANGRKIAELEALKDAVQQSGKNGKPVQLVLIRQGQKRELRVTPDGPKPPAAEARRGAPKGQRPQVTPPGHPMAAQMGEMRELIERQQQQIRELRLAMGVLERNARCRCEQE